MAEPVTIRLDDDEQDVYLRWSTARERAAQWKAVADDAEAELKLICGIKPDQKGETPPVVAVNDTGETVFTVTPFARRTVSTRLLKEERPDVYAQYETAVWVRTIKAG